MPGLYLVVAIDIQPLSNSNCVCVLEIHAPFPYCTIGWVGLVAIVLAYYNVVTISSEAKPNHY